MNEEQGPSHLLEVNKYTNVYQAHIVKGFLESQGLDPVVMGDDLGGNRPHLSIITGVRVMVPSNQVATAKQLLKEADTKLKLAEPDFRKPTDYLMRAMSSSILGLLVPLLPSIWALWNLYLAKKDAGIEVIRQFRFWFTAFLSTAAILLYIRVFIFGLTE